MEIEYTLGLEVPLEVEGSCNVQTIVVCQEEKILKYGQSALGGCICYDQEKNSEQDSCHKNKM